MNARKTISWIFVLAMSAVSAAQAAPTVGTNKANGIYSGFGWPSQSVARSQPSYRPSAPATYYRAPAVQAAPAPMVAQAPTEGRRFSYAPAPAAPAAASSAPCPQGSATAAVPVTNGARRFSYSPAPEASVTPAPATAPRVYSTRPSSTRRGTNGSTLEQWQLPKTDPRKYTNR